MRRALQSAEVAALCAALVAGCGSSGTRPAAVSAAGPPRVVRVALTDFRWPLDPALARGRDETTLARALYSTPLRLEPDSGAPAAGLCSGWSASDDFRTWTFTCRSAAPIAASLRRVANLPDAPLHWLFEDVRASAPSADRLVVRLPFAWRRFPYALTTVAAAPRFVPGPFRLVSGSPQRVVATNAALRLEFRRYPSARAAQRAFERGEVDEAPVPLGESERTRARLGKVVRSRTLLALDGVVLRRLQPKLRRVYWQTADRNDYAELVDESRGAVAVKAQPRAYRRALAEIQSLPRVRVRVGVPPDPTLRYGARILYAQWRDSGLGPQLVTEPATAPDATIGRWFAAYPQDEAIAAQLGLADGVGSRARLLRALAATEQRAALGAFDADLRESARFVPLAWVVDARLVSPRLQGWRENALGDVDYAAVRSLASSRAP